MVVVALALMVALVHVNVFDTFEVTTGLTVFCVIVVLAVAVHPFAAVTITVNVPGVLIVGLAVVGLVIVPGPVQLYPPPPVPVKLAVRVVQVKVVVLLALAVGVVVFCVMVVLAVAVHPLAAVTNKLYVPAWLTFAVALVGLVIVPGPVHEYVPPPVPTMFAVRVVQVKVVLLVAVIDGAVVFWVMDTTAALVQLFIGFVMVSV